MHGGDIVRVAGAVGDQEPREVTVGVAGRAAADYRQEMC